MDNFIFGIQNLAMNLNNTLFSLMRHQLVWGFAFGFAASTLIHFFVILDHPKYFPSFVRKPASECFVGIAPRKKDGTFEISYVAFQREYNRIRVVFYSTLMSFFLALTIVLLRF